MNEQLQVREGIGEEEEAKLLDLLKSYNVATFGESDRRELAVPLYDDGGQLIGGLTGYTGRGWLYIAMLFVPEHLRERGLAARMLELAEAEARSRGCIGAYIDTMNPAARKLYIKCGYSPIGTLEGLAGGHAITWLQKPLSPSP
ncbi:GNAT family N-acetyltransferase [Rhizobium sp. NTR19]|uniref:GNAT family N-acetyltransferase n=1 Tax=Neorhizobium turbinariae TaxID=2937795 RepID=A0ABT0IKN3_9HYPH|nr:GNAT family N-acetyltransferase [Neorhizobium turbinariae]MCK8778431.1 GNAT family N-acetyltransferase [Neorhizobium turbinariae]